MGLELVDMGENGVFEVCGVPLTRKLLAKLRLKAQRCNAWFRLKRDERRFIDLVITVVQKVRNVVLAKILSPIVQQLLGGMGNWRAVVQAAMGNVAYLMKVRGRSLAQKLSQVAQTWGNESAARWPDDKGFVKFLTVMNLPSFRTKIKKLALREGLSSSSRCCVM